jgi:hypothetical protein
MKLSWWLYPGAHETARMRAHPPGDLNRPVVTTKPEEDQFGSEHSSVSLLCWSEK